MHKLHGDDTRRPQVQEVEIVAELGGLPQKGMPMVGAATLELDVVTLGLSETGTSQRDAQSAEVDVEVVDV